MNPFPVDKEDLRQFRSQPLNRLSIENRAFQDAMLQLSYTSPEAFFAMRRTALRSLLDTEVTRIHALIFNFLTEGRGTNGDGTSSGRIIDNDNQDHMGQSEKARDILGSIGGFIPRVSDEEADKLSMDVCAGFASLLEDKVLNRVLPKDIFSSTLNRAAKKATVNVE